LHLPRGIPGAKEIDEELGVDYFSVRVEFGAYHIETLNDFEKKLFDVALGELNANIEKGLQFVKP
jgi:hypothetical protein